jgi:phosphoribosylformimino-5-aminoimidazole carboxamide ribotide isomerase
MVKQSFILMKPSYQRLARSFVRAAAHSATRKGPAGYYDVHLIRLIPVIDIRNGVAVRGMGGHRDLYQPIVSRLTESTDPRTVARALVDEFQPAEIYVADLDCFRGAAPAVDLYRSIRAIGTRVFVEAGVAGVESAEAVAACGCEVVAGLETVSSPIELEKIVRGIGADRVAFSLDLRAGRPMTAWPIVEPRSAIHVTQAVIDTGITRLIVLDLVRVGTGHGTGTEELCRRVVSNYPHVDVFAGGGIAGPEDVNRLEECGVKGVLAASALHDGRLWPSHFRHS